MRLRLWRHEHFDRDFELADDEIAVGFERWLRAPLTSGPANFDLALRQYIADELESAPDPAGLAILADCLWPRLQGAYDGYLARQLGKTATSLRHRRGAAWPRPSAAGWRP